MKIRKFDRKIDDIDIVADLILKAYSESGQEVSIDESSTQMVSDFIETGNNFIGKESIYVCLKDDNIAGLVVGYPGKSYSKLKTTLNLLLKFRMTQIFNYLVVSSQLFDTGYTPYLEEDDFYISVIVVDSKYRNRGIGTKLLNYAAQIARDRGCKQIVLEVDRNNQAAMSLYMKYGFTTPSKKQEVKISSEYDSLQLMQLNLNGLANG